MNQDTDGDGLVTIKEAADWWDRKQNKMKDTLFADPTKKWGDSPATTSREVGWLLHGVLRPIKFDVHIKLNGSTQKKVARKRSMRKSTLSLLAEHHFQEKTQTPLINEALFSI